jgi:hypothetical protein
VPVNKQSYDSKVKDSEILFGYEAGSSNPAVGIMLLVPQVQILEVGCSAAFSGGSSPTLKCVAYRVTAGALSDASATVSALATGLTITATGKSIVDQFNVSANKADVSSLLDSNHVGDTWGVALQARLVITGSPTVTQACWWVRYRPIELPQTY